MLYPWLLREAKTSSANHYLQAVKALRGRRTWENLRPLAYVSFQVRAGGGGGGGDCSRFTRSL